METVSVVLAWISANPAWAGVGVFLVAFLESLALVGLVLPGAAMMFAIGALMGGGSLPLWSTLGWAAAGAIAGDGVSFWLGRRYHMQIKRLWPLRNHPELIAGATDFFYRHGGKSILIGRFIGPIRPVIPAVAGMLEMPTRRFLAFNILSALLWAPAYLLPGMLFATSLGLASEVASRLAVVLATLFGTLFVALWLLRMLFNRLHRHAYPLLQHTLAWTRRHPLAGRIPASLLDPEQPEARGLTLLALLLLATSTLFALVAHASGQEGLLFHLDNYLLNATETLRTPPVDNLSAAVVLLGEWQVLLPVALVISAWLWRHNHRHALHHWLAAAGLGALLSLNLLWLAPTTPDPPTVPLRSGQLLAAVAIYGFLAVLIAREFTQQQRRWRIYAVAAILLLGLALARLYLGASTLSGVMGALTLGVAWIALLGLGYRSHPGERLAPGQLALVALLTLSLSGFWHGVYSHQQTLQRYSVQRESEPMTLADWWQEGWRELPIHRGDLRGYSNHPLNLQYAGSLQALTRRLNEYGWRQPPEVGALNWLAWLNPDTPTPLMPVLPQVHDGHNEALLRVLDTEEEGKMLTLRLWPSRHRVQPTGQPLWVGNVTWLQPVTQVGVTAPRTIAEFDTPLQRLRALQLPLESKPVRRDSTLDGWGGKVLLLQTPP
ncbi:MAG: VTT domain-containing protein [Pseudomonadota bacterium]